MTRRAAAPPTGGPKPPRPAPPGSAPPARRTPPAGAAAPRRDPAAKPLPAIFVSHGAPTLALETGATPRFLHALGTKLARPTAVVCVSAHWQSAAPRVTLGARPATVHDFEGFPERLYAIRYAAPGEPALARRVVDLLRAGGIDAEGDEQRGFDHGAWVPLLLMYPDATVPVVQLSVQPRLGPRHHLAVGRALRSLRREGVLILGSGGATHNLGEAGGEGVNPEPPEWARAFDEWLRVAVEEGRPEDLVEYSARAPEPQRNHPTSEHFMPLFVPLGAAGSGEAPPPGRRIHSGFTWGSLSMAAYAWE